MLITERIIKIHTTATDKDGKKEIEAGKDVTIVDTVKLEGLEVGTKYQLVGWQMLKEENAELIINDKCVENDYIFTADSETMEVKIEFTFDASTLGGKQLVTFEELYDLSNPDKPIKVTEHILFWLVYRQPARTRIVKGALAFIYPLLSGGLLVSH